jgi:cytochrome c oxidase subunit II
MECFGSSHLLAQASFWLEPAASTSAEAHDPIFYTVLYVSAAFFAIVVALMLTFIVVFRRRPGVAMADGPTHNTPLELVWTAIPLAVVITLFVMGLRAFVALDVPPANAEPIEVRAQQWSFAFVYPNGAESEKLYLEVDRPVVLQMQSADVMHGVYIPAFRIQRDVIPGRTERLWLKPTRPGEYHLFCTEYCGDGHSLMTTQCVVLDAAGYSAKLAELSNIFLDPATKKPLPYAKVGERLYKTSGCAQCHTVDGSPGQGPTWLGLYKSDVRFSVAPPGYTLTAADSDAKWDAYLRESILDPGAKIVAGYQNVMPSAAPQYSGSAYKDKKLEALIEYIKSVKKK